MSKNRRIRDTSVSPRDGSSGRRREVIGVVGLGAAVFLLVALVSLQAGQMVMGPFGRSVASLFYGVAGVCGYFLIAVAIVAAIRTLIEREPVMPPLAVLGALLAVASLAVIAQLVAADSHRRLGRAARCDTSADPAHRGPRRTALLAGRRRGRARHAAARATCCARSRRRRTAVCADPRDRRRGPVLERGVPVRVPARDHDGVDTPGSTSAMCRSRRRRGSGDPVIVGRAMKRSRRAARRRCGRAFRARGRHDATTRTEQAPTLQKRPG
jgi:hypothetical protein